jgi:uncharacterized protein (TIGR02265 family)
VANLVFHQTFEALSRALGDRLDAPLKAKLKEVGVDYDAPLLPAYPLEVWAQAMTLGATALFPEIGADEQPYHLGRRFLDSYSETLVGKALLAMIRVLGPKRTLERMTRNLRSANNYTETELVPLPDGAFRLTFNRVLVPAFYRGLVQRSVEVAGAQGVDVRFEGRAGEAAAFVVRWQ